VLNPENVTKTRIPTITLQHLISRDYVKMIPKLKNSARRAKEYGSMSLSALRKANRIGMLGLVVCVIWLMVISKYPPAEVSPTEARSTLLALIGILATILAISISLFMVSIQFVSETYTPRIVKTLMEDPIFRGYVGEYAISISLIVFSLTLGFFPPQTALILAHLLFLVSFFFLLIFLFHAPNLLHPSRTLERLAKKVPTDFCEQVIDRMQGRAFVLRDEDEPVIAIEQTLVRTVDQNDFSTFLRGIEYLESILTGFLHRIKRELKTSNNKSETREKPSYVFGYFLRIYRRLLAESLSHCREEHLLYLCRSLSALMRLLHTIRAHRAFDWTAELYDLAGLQGVDKRLVTFLEDYLRDLSDLTKIQIGIFDEDASSFEEISKWSGLSKEEQHLQTDVDILAWSAESRIRHLSKLATEAAGQGLDSVVSSCMHIFSETLDRILLLPVGKRRYRLQEVARELLETHKACVDGGISSTTFTTGMLKYKIENLKGSDEVNEFGIFVAAAYAEMGVYSIEKGFYKEIWQWGVNGRSLIERYPEHAKAAVHVLEKSLQFFTSNRNDKTRAYYGEARRQLESIRDWENHPHKEVRDMINKILEKYPPEVPA